MRCRSRIRHIVIVWLLPGCPGAKHATLLKCSFRLCILFVVYSSPVKWVCADVQYLPFRTLHQWSSSRHPSSSSTTAHALSLSRGALSNLFTRRLVSIIHIDAHNIGAFYATFCTVKKVSNCRCRIGYLCAINHVDIGDAGLCAGTFKHCK